MLIRLAGCDADMEFSDHLQDLVARAQEAFPAPEYAVMYADAQDEEEDDTLTIARRYSGILIPMVYVTLDELEELDAEGVDWIGQIQGDLARTQAEVDAEVEVEPVD